MPDGLAKKWFGSFMKLIQIHETSGPLREAAIAENLLKWTEALTSAVVATCETLQWTASAKGHACRLLPIGRYEYLGIDVMAFEGESMGGWHFPVAVFELENSKRDEAIAYSLWKVMCVHADLRVVFCYRAHAADGPPLAHYLQNEVILAMSIEKRTDRPGETLVVVGSRSEASNFPYGFFKPWFLDANTGKFYRD